MLLSDLTENQQPFLDSILKEDADVFGMCCWAIKNDKKIVEDWEMIREEYKEATGINLTEKQLHEVNWKKLAATAAMIGTLLTPGMAQAYTDSDLIRIGFERGEVSTLQAMDPQPKADAINAQIDKIGGGADAGGGYYYDFPKVDAKTVVDPNEVRPAKKQGVSTDSTGKPIDDVAKFSDEQRGTCDPAKLQKQAEILSTVLMSDRRLSTRVQAVYYSEPANKIVVIPNYPDTARIGSNIITGKMDNDKIISSIGQALFLPNITKAIAKFGIPSLDMNNVIIVDRGERAPRR